MRWVRELFAPTLRDYLDVELGQRDTVFEDSRLEDGGNFPSQLYTRLGESALLVPLLTASYFNRPWCVREFAVMREREKSLGIRENDDTRTLILPIFLGGRDMFPEPVKDMQSADFSRFYNAHLGEGTPRREAFTEAVQNWASRAATTFKQTCPHSADFAKMRGNSMIDELRPPAITIPVPSMIPPASAAA